MRVNLDGEGGDEPREVKPEDTRVTAKAPRAAYRALTETPLATDLVYGLVNVRTDGTDILCATMKESGAEFDVKVFKAGVEA